MFAGNKGFTILEIVLGVSIFMVGLLGVAALQISAINAEAFSARVTEGTLLARSTFEQLMTLNYTDGQLDDDDGSGVDGGGDPVADAFNADIGLSTNKNLDDGGVGAPSVAGDNIPDAFQIADERDADLQGIGTNGIFNVAWSVCEDCLINDTKSVRVIVYWRLKSGFQSIDFYGLIPRK
jgi:type II secretory pathway pseudopilin PulG